MKTKILPVTAKLKSLILSGAALCFSLSFSAVDDGPSEKAGIKAGDLLLALGEKSLVS
jgi:hypothetical protein